MTDLVYVFDEFNSPRTVPYKFLWMSQMGYKESSSILLEVYVHEEIEKDKKGDNK